MVQKAWRDLSDLFHERVPCFLQKLKLVPWWFLEYVFSVPSFEPLYNLRLGISKLLNTVS